jgi:predicted RNase H-like HicB family nuclease
VSGTIYVVPSGPSFLASVADLPGCVARGDTKEEAVSNVRRAFPEYLALLRRYGVSTHHWDELDPAVFEVRDAPDDRLIPDDERPLEEHEIRDFLHQMEGSRSALLAIVRELSPDELERRPTQDTWSVRQTLEHILTTEAVLLSRMDRWPDGYPTLQAVHRMAFQRFTVLEPGDVIRRQRVGDYAWSTRKVMRRILEHEYEHMEHIKQIIAALGGQRAPE